MRLAAILALAVFPASATLAADFDCAKAASRVERAICADAGLSDLDGMLGRYYQGALLALAENAACLREDQQRWLRVVRNACADAACLRNAYLDRLSELQPLQPGINLQRKLELPARPALVWAIAPEADRIMAPPVGSRPFEAKGTLTYRGDLDSGYFLEAGATERYLLMPDAMLGGSTASALPSLARWHRDARLSARGYVTRDDRQNPYFDRRHCLFLHRLP